ncbi:MAG: CopD family protein [Chromatiales bacterium]|jgi:uncharacterized membrane protein
MGIALLLHIVAVIVWVGGMVFAWAYLRPVAAAQLEPPVRLTLWVGVFDKFFPYVWASIVLILASGLWIIFAVMGGFGGAAMHVHLMLTLGVIMMLIFFHVFFAPYKRLKRAVDAQDWPAGGKALAQIRKLVGINMAIGLITAAIGSGGKYLLG